MDPQLDEIFEQARRIVTEEDRRLAEEQERQRDKQREASLVEFSGQVIDAFDFTSKEKMELGPRLDLRDSKPLIEFVVRGVRAVFILAAKDANLWTLNVAEDGREPQALGDFQGGKKGDGAARRLAAARVVTAIGAFAQAPAPALKKAEPAQSRWQDRNHPPAVEKAEKTERREPTYGTFGKFLGY